MSRKNPTKKWLELQKAIPANHVELLEYEAKRNAEQNEERKYVELHCPPHKRRRKK